MSEKKVPELRFKGFSGEWERLKLSDVADIVGGGTPSTQIPEYWNGEIAWYSPTEIDKSVYADRSQKTITELGFEKCSAKMLPANTTVLFTSRAGIGDMAILRHPATTNQGFQSFVLKNGYSTYFLYSSGCYIKLYALKNASGSTFLEISGKQLGKMDYNVPDEKEQTKIGDFFKNLDNLIAQNQKKYDKLVNMKKACLDKMFPKDGADTPEVRFQEFGGGWEKQELGEIYNFKYGYFNNNPSNGGQYPVYGANGIIGGYSEYNAEDSIIIGHMGEYAGCVLWGRGKHFVTYNGTITVPKSSAINSKYGYFMLLNLDIKNICNGSGQPFLSYNMLEKINCTYPLDYNEQAKIGNFFQTLDNLITLQKTKLEKLKNIKKACLDRMFI